MPDLIEADPRLMELAAKIRQLIADYDAAGAFQLASSTHAEFGMELPDWSAVWLTPEGLRVKSSSEHDGLEHLESSLHLLLSMRDMLNAQTNYMNNLGSTLIKALAAEGIEVEHRPFGVGAEEPVAQ